MSTEGTKALVSNRNAIGCCLMYEINIVTKVEKH